MSDRKSPVEQALDLFVFAPIGLAMAAREELPKLADKGHQQVSGQVALAKMIGQMAVAEGRKEATKLAKRAADTVSGLQALAGSGTSPAGRRGQPSTRARAEGDGAAGNGAVKRPARPARAAASVVGGGRAQAGGSAATAAVLSDDHLAIPGYSSLSASQVVQRLAGLSRDELEAVRSFEQGTRGRRTILNRIDQLQGGSAT